MDLPFRFGKYELLERIATGGMAEVFLARSFGVEGFEKRLVIKRILPALANNPRFVSMFIEEAKISVGLVHPNIVQIFELGRVGEDHYMAMEYIHGRDLTRVNRQARSLDRSIPVPLAVYVASCVLRGLSYAHRLRDSGGEHISLVHRDVSPHNILVTFHGEVKLVDFGIARLAGAQQGCREGPGGGKYAYMSPEQALGRELDGRSDIYSTGIVLWEMLVGRRLFRHEDPAERLRMVCEAEVPDPRSEVAGLSDRLWQVLQKMLALNPGDRHLRADLAEEELRAVLFEEGCRVGPLDVASFLRELVDLGEEPAALGLDVRGLARDLARLDASSLGSEGSASGSTQPGEGQLPGITTDHTPAVADQGEHKPVAVLVAEVCGLTSLSRT
ncbi:MAG: serine/threonine-protein kinase, partial [Myxococcota bacterium]|nr:serine/threonine-protein kinase [Myxococcota bacterium]